MHTRLFAGNCYFSVTQPVNYSFHLSLDPSGLPPMGREDNNIAKTYNVFVKNKVTSKYEHIGQLQIANCNCENYKITYNWWKSLEWLRAKIILRQVIAGKLPVIFANRCCRCGKIISHERALHSGFGPECEKYFIGGDNIANKSM